VGWNCDLAPCGPGSCFRGASAGAGALSARIERTKVPTDTAGMAKKPPKLFWLTYRHPGGPGVVVIESRGLLHARLKALVVIGRVIAALSAFGTNGKCSPAPLRSYGTHTRS
jgi:hypothetical protein